MQYSYSNGFFKWIFFSVFISHGWRAYTVTRLEGGTSHMWAWKHSCHTCPLQKDLVVGLRSWRWKCIPDLGAREKHLPDYFITGLLLHLSKTFFFVLKYGWVGRMEGLCVIDVWLTIIFPCQHENIIGKVF